MVFNLNGKSYINEEAETSYPSVLCFCCQSRTDLRFKFKFDDYSSYSVYIMLAPTTYSRYPIT